MYIGRNDIHYSGVQDSFVEIGKISRFSVNFCAPGSAQNHSDSKSAV